MPPTPRRARARILLRSARIAVHGQDGENAQALGHRTSAPGQHSAPSANSATMQGVMRDQRTDESVISPELQLAVECCRHNFAGNRGSVAPRPSAGLDWQGFLALVRFHRVQGLAWKALDDAGLAPPAIAEALSRDTEKIAAANLRAAAEFRDLLDDFEAAEVPALFVKGLTGAALAYRHPLLKMSSDIDLLVAPRNVVRGELLARRGYRQANPATSGRRRSLAQATQGIGLGRAENGLHVELHSRLADNSRLIPCIDIDSPSETVDVAPGIRASDARPRRAVRLSVRSRRLERLVQAQVDHRPCRPGPWPVRRDDRAPLRRSQALGAERAAGQALLLADRLFGTLTRYRPPQDA